MSPYFGLTAVMSLGCAIVPALAASGANHARTDQIVLGLRAQDGAVLRVGERLAVAGSPFCANQGRSAGMTVQLLGQYGPAYREAARRLLGFGAYPTIAAIAAGGAADQAGLRAGDAIIAIDGHMFAPVDPGDTASGFGPTGAMLDVVDAALADGEASLSISRGSRAEQVVLNPRPACRARFDVRAGRANNAYSDGLYVQIASDLVARVRGDGELATVMAHELAHNILNHPARLKAKRPRPSVRQTEIEADRLSVYLLDAAGYSLEDAVGFWASWGRSMDYGIFSDPKHPRWKQRIAILRAEAAVIAAQRAAGQPIRLPPDLMSGR